MKINFVPHFFILFLPKRHKAMKNKVYYLYRVMNQSHSILSVLLLALFCAVAHAQDKSDSVRIIPADERTELYLPLLQGKRVALLANHTAQVGERHLLDLLLAEGVSVTGVFSPEHGFRGTVEAGGTVQSSVDERTGVPILSLYGGGRSKGPSERDMQTFDLLVVDLQDVGLRFYTYYISMFYMMDACASRGKEVVVLDRPNPNGFYVDGPVLDVARYKSGIGLLPIPVVHGMTLGELARMINGEGWLTNGRQCRLKVIPCAHYTRRSLYRLPSAPSPNLPNMQAVYLYPSLCLFEGTVVSLGRGTDKPFQVYGHPLMEGGPYSFTPRSISAAKNPPQCDKLCHGFDLSTMPQDSIRKRGLDLTYVIDAYRRLNMGDRFFTSFFERLIGVDYVRRMIEQGCSADEIRACWQEDVERFKEQRKPYLLYTE